MNNNLFLPKSYDLLLNSGDERQVYSDTKLHPFSICTGDFKIVFENKKLRLPSPMYRPDLFLKLPKLDFKNLFEGIRIDNRLGIVLTDPETKNKFKGIVGEMIKNFLKSKFTNSSFSLPVRIFEPKSTLHRICDYFVFFPTILREAASQTNPWERMKLTMVFLCAGLHISVKQLKPFNCILGETFEASFPDGSEIYIEHICHNPTTIRILILSYDRMYALTGYLEFFTKSDNLWGTRILVMQKGELKVHFYENKTQTISFHMPCIKLVNTTSVDDRAAHWVKNLLLFDEQNKLKGVVNLGGNKNQIDEVQGGIYEYDQKYEFDEKYENQEAEEQLGSGNMKMKLEGSYLQHIKFDGKQYWHLHDFESSPIICKERPLPSDGRYREDLMWLLLAFNAESKEEKEKCEQLAQKWKEILENLQRSDKKRRNKY